MPLELKFAQCKEFRLNSNKIFDENADMIERIQDLDILSNKINVLYTLFSAVTSNTDLNVESIKTIVVNSGISVNDVIKITAYSITKISF